MKKLINILVIISVFVLAGMQNVSAQIEINFYWTSNCGDTCVSHDICTYQVSYEMYYICDGHHDLLCDGGPSSVGCSETSIKFYCDYSCDDPSNDPCYYINATATKLCTGKNGTIIKCTGHYSGTKTCSYIMNDPLYLPITWE
jgi:hypothetical protein